MMRSIWHPEPGKSLHLGQQLLTLLKALDITLQGLVLRPQRLQLGIVCSLFLHMAHS